MPGMRSRNRRINPELAMAADLQGKFMRSAPDFR
jgi:hypothetical protein